MSWENFLPEIHPLNLNPQTPDKSIYIIATCGDLVTIKLNEFIRNKTNKSINLIGKLFIAYIPVTSKIFVSTFCCGINMEQIHNKFNDFGLAIQGCYQVNPATLKPYAYRGYGNLEMDKIIESNITDNQSFLVIDNHNITKIMSGTELMAYKPTGVNVQYIEGLRILTNGAPIEVSFFESFIKKITFSEPIDPNLGFLIFAKTYTDDTFIIYHKKISLVDTFTLLSALDCSDALILCNSSNANIIWKTCAEYNLFNQTNFIGNPSELVSNIIAFSG